MHASAINPPDATTAYAALLARDASFDGRFFVGVTSTGIYCRPVCRVRVPKAQNCRFFASHALAEAAHFRPCLKCRPEIAPGLSQMDSSHALAQAAHHALLTSVGSGTAPQLAALAAKLGITDRHLRRIFLAAYGVSPLAFVTTQRLLLAKQLLTDTQQPVTQVALGCGFGSLRRFNTAFLQHYRLNPSQLRRAARTGAQAQPQARAPVLRLAYRPPFDAPSLLAFFAQRALPGVEAVSGNTWHRTLCWPHAGGTLQGWVSASPDLERHQLLVQLSDSLLPVAGALLMQLRHCFDLDAEPRHIDAALFALQAPKPAPQLLPLPGLRLPGCMDSFEVAVRVVLGQQVTVKAARTLALRVVQRFGQPINTPFAALTHVFPSADALAHADPAHLGELGIVRQRVGAIQALARAVQSGQLDLRPGADASAINATCQALCALPGIGPWTAQVIALRALHHTDAWPAADIGLMNALGSRNIKDIEARGDAFRPWRSYAVMRLWHHLETGT